MKKDIIYFICFLVVFIVFVFSITNLYLFKNIKNKGEIITNSTYSEIYLSDVFINADTASYFLVDNINKIIKLRIENLNDFNEDNVLSFNITNLGNKSLILKDLIINNISSSIDARELNIYLSISKGKVIKPGEKVKVFININYPKNIANNNHYYADILFKL